MNIAKLLLVIAALAATACSTVEGRRETTSPRAPRSETYGGDREYGGREPQAVPLPEREIAMYPRGPHGIGTGPAVLSLLSQAKTELSAGRPEKGAAALERALRMEPRNPFVWQALAQVSLAQNQPEQAEASAQKSMSFAKGNPFI